MPRVTVLMSVYNGKRYLREAIESILHQTWEDYEFLIVNDGSTDGSREIIASFDDPRVRLVDNPTNLGLTKALNRGLELARGELIARQDADDVSHPTRLEQQVSFLDANPEVALLGTQARVIDESGCPVASVTESAKPVTDLAIRWCLMFGSPFFHASVMFRHKVVWGQFQGYDERFVRSQDFELWSRIAQEYEVRNLPYALIDYRRHSESMAAREKDLHARLGEEIILSNLGRFLDDRQVPVEYAAQLNRLRVARAIRDPDRLMAMIDTMFSRFCALHPDADVKQSIRSHLADQFGLVAYHSAVCNRLGSIRAFGRACRIDVRIVKRGIGGHIPIVQYLALWVGGEFARRVYRRVASE